VVEASTVVAGTAAAGNSILRGSGLRSDPAVFQSHRLHIQLIFRKVRLRILAAITVVHRRLLSRL
jgi:hypothetical protein